MKKKVLKDWIIAEYLELIKDEHPHKHDIICDILNISKARVGLHTIRTSLPEGAWRILQQTNEVLKDAPNTITAPKD